MRRSLLFLLFFLFSGTCSDAQDTKVFENPTVDGGRLDLCLVWGDQCGQAAAEAFCKMQGLAGASAWEPANDVGSTIVLTGRRPCSDPGCDGFASIICTGAGGAQTTAEGTQVQNGDFWTTQDVIDPRIDEQAQYSLMRMFETGGEEGADASAILSAVKAEVLTGIYQQDQKKPALRAQKVGKGWWQLFDGQSSDRLAFCWKEPASAPPMMVMRKGAKSSKESLDPALREAWKECGLPSEPSKPYEGTLPSKPGG